MRKKLSERVFVLTLLFCLNSFQGSAKEQASKSWYAEFLPSAERTQCEPAAWVLPEARSDRGLRGQVLRGD